LTPAFQRIPTRIPKVRFIPIKRGLRSNNIISEKAINFLTNCVWAKSLNIYTPTKLRPAATPMAAFDFQQVAMPMVHPMTGETISSYKRCTIPQQQRFGRQHLVKALVEWHKAMRKLV
jgi:hypothetical protein